MQGLMAIAYIIIGLFQLIAVMAGLDVWIGLQGISAAPIAYFIAYIPLVGNVAGMFAAVAAWNWSWLQAAGLFFGPYVAILILAMPAGVLGRIWKSQTSRAVAG